MNKSFIYSLTGTVWANMIYDGTSSSLIRTGTGNALENNVSCDMPGQIRYMNWLILIMPLSMSMLNRAISLGREGPGICFTTNGLLSVKLCHQFGKKRAGELFYTNRSAQYQTGPSIWVKNGRGVALHQPYCSTHNGCTTLPESTSLANPRFRDRA